MELLEAMRTTFSCRDFTDEPVTDDQLHRILDVARFAPSGGNRQGAHVVVVRDREMRQRLGDLCGPTMRLYAAQGAAGENPFNTVVESMVDAEAVMAAEDPGDTAAGRSGLFENLGDVAVVLVVSVDLSVVASMDKDLDRVGLVTGASVYPLVWNILLAARTEGLAGVVTTAVVPAEDEVRDFLACRTPMLWRRCCPSACRFVNSRNCRGVRWRISPQWIGSTASGSATDPKSRRERRRGTGYHRPPDRPVDWSCGTGDRRGGTGILLTVGARTHPYSDKSDHAGTDRRDRTTRGLCPLPRSVGVVGRGGLSDRSDPTGLGCGPRGSTPPDQPGQGCGKR